MHIIECSTYAEPADNINCSFPAIQLTPMQSEFKDWNSTDAIDGGSLTGSFDHQHAAAARRNADYPVELDELAELS